MKTEKIKWYAFDKDSLPKALFGNTLLKKKYRSTLPVRELKMGQVALGYSGEQRATKYTPPSLIILGDKTSAETFSWLRVYANETSPLSQFGRVALVSDWDMFSPRIASEQKTTQREDRWASVIVGEILAQGESGAELEKIPLSRASACFSTTIARTASIHGYGSATRECIKRLEQLETDHRFVRKPVSVSDIIPIWAITSSEVGDSVSAMEAPSLVLDAILQYRKNNGFQDDSFVSKQLMQFQGLFSDSIEERVVEYNNLVDELIKPNSQGYDRSVSEVILAAATFLVGRGTTHVYLLQKFAQKLPASYIWFALMAALVGPRCWNPDWSRAVKGAEKLVRAKFDWLDPIVTDLSWAEFSWFAKTIDGSEGFAELPKLLSRVLSIEIVPGAACQFRLATEEESITESKVLHEVNVREKDLQDALEQFVNLSDFAKSLLLKTPEPVQQSLFNEDNKNYKNTSTRKTNRNKSYQQRGEKNK